MRRLLFTVGALLWLTGQLHSQDVNPVPNNAGYVPVISGGAGYVYNVNGGAPSQFPQINPVLLVPFGSHVLLESRVGFFGFFQPEHQTYGPYTGKVIKSVDYAQVDWLANTHVMATAGRYILPFGLYGERLLPVWIRNIQDVPIAISIGNPGAGAGDGVMLRGVVSQSASRSIQYSSYFSARSSVNQLQAARTAGGDVSVYWPNIHLEVGTSYQRLLQDQQMNSVATYLSWQADQSSLDVKLEYDRNHHGNGYWLESAYKLDHVSQVPRFVRRTQVVGRMQQFFPLNGGGGGLPTVNTQRFDAGLNYYFRDDLRFVSSYGRQFSSQRDANVWNVGFTYRFLFPLWPARRK